MTKKMTYAEYLEQPDVKALDDAEIGRIKEAREHSEAMERKIDAEYNAQFVKAREEREKAKAEFRQEVIDAVWDATVVANNPYMEFQAEYAIGRGNEKAVDEAIDAAWEKLNTKMELIK